jgi:hypothetical protein
MAKLAMMLLVLGALLLFVDHQHRLLADDIYCRIGAGELRQTRPQGPLAPPPQTPLPRPGWEVGVVVGGAGCLHGSVWDAIMGRHNWYQDSNP